MKNFFKFLISFFLGLFVIYSTFWFVAASFVKNRLITKIEKLKNKDILISYDSNITTSGYPIKLRFTLPSLKISLKTNREFKLPSNSISMAPFEIFSDSVSLTSDLFVNYLNVEFGDNTTLKLLKTTSTYNQKNNILLGLSFTKPMILHMNSKDFASFWSYQYLSSLSYKDSGFNVSDNRTKKEIFKFSKNLINLDIEQKNNENNNKLFIESTWQDSREPLQKIDLLTKFSYSLNDNKGIKRIEVEKISLKSSDDSSILAEGAFSKKEDKNQLSGEIKLEFNNYPKILTFLVKNQIIKEEGPIKASLQKIANIDDQAKDAHFTIKYDGQREPIIGKFTFTELIMFYYSKK